MLPSSLPGRRHSSCSPQSAISVSLANNNTRTQSTARDTESEQTLNLFSVFRCECVIHKGGGGAGACLSRLMGSFFVVVLTMCEPAH
jgi:hypothetical protein